MNIFKNICLQTFENIEEIDILCVYMCICDRAGQDAAAATVAAAAAAAAVCCSMIIYTYIHVYYITGKQPAHSNRPRAELYIFIYTCIKMTPWSHRRSQSVCPLAHSSKNGTFQES